MTIRSNSGEKIKTGQVELACTEQSWQKESASDSGQGRLQSNQVLPKPLVQSFIADAEVKSGEPLARYARFQVPTDAPPTVHGAIAQVSWEVTANVEFDTGKTVTKSREVTVLTPPVAVPRRSAADLTEEATFSGCTLAMVLVNDVVGAGGYLEGELRARMNVTDQAKDIRMELISIETAGDRQTESVRERLSLESNVQLTVNRPYVWAFSLPVPERTLPTVKIGKTSVSWLLKAVVETDQGAEAYHLEREVQIFTSV
ncbi:MAG: hypothetical protein OSB07_09795 [Dehalococcoidia bacterium]|nr:hypothetical protein [Dehalococcoidia bacterium]